MRLSFLATLFDNMVIGDEVKYDFLLCRDYSAAGVVNDRSTRPRTHIPPHISIQSKAYSRGLYYASFSAFGRAYLVDQSTAETMSTHLRLFSLQFLERFNVISIFF